MPLNALAFCEKCNEAVYLHKDRCSVFKVNLDDEWGMARRSDAWIKAEQALREVVCSEYGHIFAPGPPWSWKTYCFRCGIANPEAPK